LAGFLVDIEVKCILRLPTIAPISEKIIKIISIPALPKNQSRNKTFKQGKIDNQPIHNVLQALFATLLYFMTLFFSMHDYAIFLVLGY
jgi:hypothetical protein